MGSIYVIGGATGPVFVGKGRKPETDLAKFLVSTREPLRLVGHWPMENDAMAELGYRIVMAKLEGAGFVSDGDWWPENARALIVDSCHDFHARMNSVDDPQPSAAEVMVALRTVVFQTTQGVMAHICGVSFSQISRYESGAGIEPGWTEMMLLRKFALDAGLPWLDEFLFRPAQPGEGERQKPAQESKRKGNRNGKK